MAQERYWNWKDNDYTLRLNQRDNAMFPPGRYRGFDTKSYSGMNLTVAHTSSGYTKILLDGSAVGNIGVWTSPQGVVVTETGAIAGLAILPNVTDLQRIDILVGSHQYVETTGGAAAFYSIVTGTPGAVPPAVLSPSTDTILGFLYVPAATTTNLANCTFVPYSVPDFGGDITLAHKDRINIFTAQNTFAGFGSNAIYTAKILIPAETGTPYSNIVLPYIVPGLSSSGIGNHFVIEAHSGQSVSDDTITFRVLQCVPNPSTVPLGWECSILTPYRLNLLTGSHFEVVTRYGESLLEYIVEKGNVFHLKKMASNKWQISSGFDPNRNTKLESQLIFNAKQVPLKDTGALGGSGTGLMDKGNIWHITNPEGQDNRVINWIHAPLVGYNGGSPASPHGGRLIMLSFYEFTTYTIRGYATAGVAPTNYKSIYIPQDININPGTTLLLVEDVNYWRIVNLNIAIPTYPDWANFTSIDGVKVTFSVGTKPQSRIQEYKVALRGQFVLLAGATGKIARLPSKPPTKEVLIPYILRSEGWDYTQNDGGASNATAAAMLKIDTNGDVYIVGGDEMASNSIIYFDGINYDAY